MSLLREHGEIDGSRHEKVACCSAIRRDAVAVRPCRTVAKKVDCSICHADQVSANIASSAHGQFAAKGSPDAPELQGLPRQPRNPGPGRIGVADFPRNVPNLCAKCHRGPEGRGPQYNGKAAKCRRALPESIHGKGSEESGLTVTANCADCHSAHRELPRDRSRLEREPRRTSRRPAPVPPRDRGESSDAASTRRRVSKTQKELPVCSDCHTAHTIQRTDAAGLPPPHHDQCGRCHEKIAETLLRHLPREGLQARLPQDRQVLRLPRSARHPAAIGPAVASEPGQHRQDLRQVPHRLATASSPATHARHAPRPQEVPFLF